MKLLGVLVVAVSLVASGVLVVLALGETGPGSDDFARANLGCVTTLSFDEPGDYWVYVVEGQVGTTNNCPPNAFGDSLTIDLSGAQGEIELRRDTDYGVTIDGFDAESIFRFTVDDPGEYALSATGPDTNQTLAVGAAPSSRQTPLLIGAAFVGLLGLLVGAVLIMSAQRRAGRNRGEPGHPLVAEPTAVKQVGLHPLPPEVPPPGSPGTEPNRRWSPPSPSDRQG